jgi:hypothetical protein
MDLHAFEGRNFVGWLVLKAFGIEINVPFLAVVHF